MDAHAAAGEGTRDGERRDRGEQHRRERGAADERADRPAPRAGPHGDVAARRRRGRQDHEADRDGQDRPARQPGRTVPARRALHERRSRDPEQAEERGGDDEVGGAAARDAAIVPGEPDDHERARDGSCRGGCEHPAQQAAEHELGTAQRGAEQLGDVRDGEHDRALDRAPAHERQQADERDRRPPGLERSRRGDLGERLARRPVDERAGDHERDEHVVGGLQAAEEARRLEDGPPEAADVAHARARGDGVRHRRAASLCRRRARARPSIGLGPAPSRRPGRSRGRRCRRRSASGAW